MSTGGNNNTNSTIFPHHVAYLLFCISFQIPKKKKNQGCVNVEEITVKAFTSSSSMREYRDHDGDGQGRQPLCPKSDRRKFSLSNHDITDSSTTRTQRTKDPHCTAFFCGLSVKLSACAKVSGEEWICYQLIAPSGQSARRSPAFAEWIHRLRTWE